MAYFADLSVYRFLDRPVTDGVVLNVGWLDAAYPYAKGDVSPEVVKRLAVLCRTPSNRTRGYHACPFCLSLRPRNALGVVVEVEGEQFRLGSAEIRLKCGNTTYAAPNMILHYVKDHHYLPPPEFIDCLLNDRNSEGFEPQMESDHLASTNAPTRVRLQRYAAGAVLLIIAWGLFVGLLGMKDAVFFRHTVAGVAPWIVVFYIVASSGLTAYRLNRDIRGHIGYVALFVWMLACVAVNHFGGHEIISLRTAGITFFCFAVADVCLGFLVPARWIGGEKSGRIDGPAQ